MGWDIWLRRLAAVALALCWCGAAQAETRAAVCIARDDGRETAARMIVSPDRFDCRTPQTRWGPGDYWAVTQGVPSALGRGRGLVRTFSMWQDDAALWALYADGRVLPLTRVGEGASIGTATEYALPARGVAVVRILWRVRGAQNLRGIVLGVRLVGAEEHARNSVTLGINAGLVAGLCIAFMFFSLALWAALRRAFLLAYCGMVGGLLLYLLADAGILPRLFPAIDRTTEMRLNGFTFILCIAGQLWFARAYLGRELLGARADRIAGAVTLVLVSLSAAKEVVSPWQLVAFDRAIAGVLLVAFGTLAHMAYRARLGPRAIRWIWPVIALVPALLIVLRLANVFQLFSRPFAMGANLLAIMASGMFVSAMAIAYRVHRLERERDEAREREIAARLLADTDPLTGLLNRRAFLAQAIGRPGPQTLLITDLDHFKSINETIGHDGGDEVLRVFARALEAVAPPGAAVARIGGEEFAVVADADAGMSPRAMLDALRAVRMPYDIAVTTSIGTCTGPLARETDWKALYRQADRALYAAKAAGRDRARDAGALSLAA